MKSSYNFLLMNNIRPTTPYYVNTYQTHTNKNPKIPSFVKVPGVDLILLAASNPSRITRTWQR